MFCQNCGTKNKPGAKFCRKCGTALRQPATQPTPVTSQTAPTIPQPAPKQSAPTEPSVTREEHQAAVKRKKHTGWLWITAGIILAIGFVVFFIYKNNPTILSGVTHSDQAKVARQNQPLPCRRRLRKRLRQRQLKSIWRFLRAPWKGRLGMRLVTFREIPPFMYRRSIRILKLTSMTNRNGRQATSSCLS